MYTSLDIATGRRSNRPGGGLTESGSYIREKTESDLQKNPDPGPDPILEEQLDQHLTLGKNHGSGSYLIFP